MQGDATDPTPLVFRCAAVSYNMCVEKTTHTECLTV